MSRRDGWRTALALVFLAVALVVTGYLEKESLDVQLDEYCHHVSMGYWPDYAKRYEADCLENGRGG